MEFYKKKRIESKYYIDGVVLTVDDVENASIPLKDGDSVANPTNSVAFKMILEEQVRNTKVINVEWNISRYGRYTPVAIYESVYIDGVRMTRATGHNAIHIQDWSMGKGTQIKIVRSGDVIPQIKDVIIDKNIIPIFPLTKIDSGYEWHWEKSDIVLNVIEGNRKVLIKRIVHFFETIGVPKLREKTAEKMYDADMKTPESIVKSSVENMTKIKGIGKKTAQFFYDKIREILVVTPPDRFLAASTTFKTGLGKKLLKQVFRAFPDILNMKEDQIRNLLTTHKLPGIGPTRINSLSKNIPEFRAYLDSFAKSDVDKAINYYVNKLKELKAKGYNPMISKQKFVLTGFKNIKDYDFEDYIYDHNGDFASTVTSDVSAVICGNVMDITKKMTTASELGVLVFSLQEFVEKYNIPLKRFEQQTKIENED